MKILMMTNTYFPIVGGLEKSIESFTAEFRRRGHEVMIVAPEFEGMPEEEVDVVRLPAILNFNNTDFSVNIPIPGFLSRLMDNFEPDIVHSHHPFLVGDMALRLCGQYRLPLVFTYHTMYELYTHYLPIHHETVRRFLIELSVGYANLADRVIAPSEGVHGLLLERGVEPPVDVIPTGVDVKRFSKGDGQRVRRRFGIPSDALLVGTVGRLALEKNLAFLAEAVAKFLDKQKRAHFIVIGKGPAEKLIRTPFKEAGIQERLHFTGLLRDQEVVDGYHAMDIFAFSSKAETQGIVVAEAMAAGIPVVALDATGVRDIVRDGENGRLLSEEDPTEFAEALSWCVQREPCEWNRMKENARKTAEEISIERCAKRILELYEAVRLKEEMSANGKRNYWQNAVNRIKTEWNMLTRLGRATTLAISESMDLEDR